MQLALTLENPTMPLSHSGKAQTRAKTDRKTWDTYESYKSGFDRSTWNLGPSGRCMCRACGDGFGSVGSFDKHQRINSRGDVVCLDPATLGMERNRFGYWVTPNPMYSDEEAAS